jgi:hypothetical protein
MKPIKSSAELKEAIAELERKAKSHEVTLESQYEQAKVALKPANVIRNSFSSLAQTPEVRRTLVSTIIGFGIGYFSKKASQVMNEESLNRMVGGIVEHSLNKIVERDPNGLFARGIHLTKHIAKEKGIRLFG